MTNEDFEVNFAIMEKTEVEPYLGDMIGEIVTEDKRFKKGEENMDKISKRWGRTNIGYYGKAIVANTLMKAQVTYRAKVNAISKEKKKQFQNKIAKFVWDDKKAMLAWHKLVRPIREGGLAILDINCALDAEKISILRNMTKKKDQPWVPWMTRKETKLKERWNVRESVYGYVSKTHEKTGLNKQCLYESTMGIWYEVGGTTRKQHRHTTSNVNGGWGGRGGRRGKEKREKKKNKGKTKGRKGGNKKTKKEVCIIKQSETTTRQTYQTYKHNSSKTRQQRRRRKKKRKREKKGKNKTKTERK